MRLLHSRRPDFKAHTLPGPCEPSSAALLVAAPQEPRRGSSEWCMGSGTGQGLRELLQPQLPFPAPPPLPRQLSLAPAPFFCSDHHYFLRMLFLLRFAVSTDMIASYGLSLRTDVTGVVLLSQKYP